MIDVIEVHDLAGKILGGVDIGSWETRCRRCQPSVTLSPPSQMTGPEGLGAAVTVLISHLASEHGELSHPDDEDDGGAEGQELWQSAYERLRRSTP